MGQCFRHKCGSFNPVSEFGRSKHNVHKHYPKKIDLLEQWKLYD